MNRVLRLGIAIVFAPVATLAAQSAHFGIGGGATVPLGDYSTGDNAGWHALAKVDFKIPMSPVGVRVDGIFSQTSHKGIDGHTRATGGLASIVWHVPAALVKPYLLGGVGLYNVDISTGGVSASETKFTFGVGGGLSFGTGPTRFFIEGRYVSFQASGGSINFIPITAGINFGGK